MKSEYIGGCHCGAIAYRYRSAVPPDQWSIRACQCGFCRAHDALSASDPSGFVEFTAADSKLMNRYRFGLRTADFLLCRECGVYIGAFIETENGQFGIINTHALLQKPETLAATEPMSYDSEDVAGRVARREERWTPASMSLQSG
jgi:hypothetical protein